MPTPKKSITPKKRKPAAKKPLAPKKATVKHAATAALPPEPVSQLRSLVARPLLRRCYVLFALLVLAGTTSLWAYWGARVQNSNADQLSDPYLFGSAATLHAATLPGTHSFLIKWPIFWLVARLGMSSTIITDATMVLVLVTVAALVFLLYKIERRALVFGTICLSLSLLLLLVPAQPYAGGLLPVNMAMLTTRNLEYIFYIGALLLLVKAGRVRSWYFAGGIAVLSVLVASDKLFLTLSAGGAVLALLAYALAQNWNLVGLAARWLGGTVLAAVGSAGILAIIQLTHVTHFANERGVSPYSVVSTAKDFLVGALYALLGLFTNLGANPAYDATVVRQLPHQFSHRLFSLAGPAYLVAAAAVSYGFYLVWLLMWPSFRRGQKPSRKSQYAVYLSVMLVWTTVAALGVFVLTKHDYQVDARYLAISFFAVSITATTVLRSQKIRPEWLFSTGCVVSVGIILAVFSSHSTYNSQAAALAPTNQRNQLVAQVLSQHHVSVLVGDYWRVLPVKLASENKLMVMPLSDCTQPRQVLSSLTWQPNLKTHSFAYLFSLDGSLSDYPSCSLEQITKAYGRPNASLAVSGTIAQPTELLLFYDHGINKSPSTSKPQRPAAKTSTVVPTTLEEITGVNCNVPTVMTIVAHEDDDILFTNPDLLHDIASGHCIRTVFLTAGDDGGDKFYWINRQLGSEAAYDSMLGVPNEIWVQHIVRLGTGQYVTIASPHDNPKISLVFFNLPDGDLKGEGFATSHHESLAKLQEGRIKYIHAVDDQSTYTSSELKSGLTSLMNLYQPAEIRTQASQTKDTAFPDHSDHVSAGYFATVAANLYDQVHFGGLISVPVTRYIGYPIHGFAQNVFGEDLQKKEAAFLAYAKFDGGVCHSVEDCAATPTYNSYLTRQYQEK